MKIRGALKVMEQERDKFDWKCKDMLFLLKKNYLGVYIELVVTWMSSIFLNPDIFFFFFLSFQNENMVNFSVWLGRYSKMIIKWVMYTQKKNNDKCKNELKKEDQRGQKTKGVYRKKGGFRCDRIKKKSAKICMSYLNHLMIMLHPMF